MMPNLKGENAYFSRRATRVLPNAFSENGAKLEFTTPVAMDNSWRRSFLPRLKPLGLEWATFQVMRRTHSSLLKELDVDPHVRAEHIGHTVDVNENVYTISSLKRRKDAVNALEKAIGA